MGKDRSGVQCICNFLNSSGCDRTVLYIQATKRCKTECKQIEVEAYLQQKSTYKAH